MGLPGDPFLGAGPCRVWRYLRIIPGIYLLGRGTFGIPFQWDEKSLLSIDAVRLSQV